MTGTELIPAETKAQVPAALFELEDATRKYETQAKAENTKRAYRAAWGHFTAWCAEQGVEPLPAHPRAVAHYLTASADTGAKVSTMRIRLTAIGMAHRLSGHPFDAKHPQIDGAWSGIKRTVGTRPERKAAVLPDDLRRMVAKLPDTLAGKRDRALLLIGFGGAMRRSELVVLQVDDVRQDKHGLKVLIRRSKTDQEARGEEVAIHRSGKAAVCPVVALQEWLKASGITTGPIFRPIAKGGRILDQQLTDRSAAQVVKDAAEAAGLDPKQYAGHSLRAGLATSAALAGHDLMQIMRQTRHKSVDVARIYIRDADLWRDNVTKKLL
jgi:site-specific recombinase XerD